MTKTTALACFFLLAACVQKANECHDDGDCLGGELCATGQCESFSSLVGPVVTVTQPTAGGVTGATYMFAGTIIDPTGIMTLTLAGIDVTATNEGFATWQVVVPLVLGSNTIPIHAEDGAGKTLDRSVTWCAWTARGRSSLGTRFLPRLPVHRETS